MILCQSIWSFCTRNLFFHILFISRWLWTVKGPDWVPLLIMPQMRKQWTAAHSVLHAIKKCLSQMSHVLRQRHGDHRNEMRQFDSCTKNRNSVWFGMTFGEAVVYGRLRRQRQLTCALFKICEAERTKSTQGVNVSIQVSESLVKGAGAVS